ncbi:MAG: hypothetical protein C4337_02170, partial [Armatimonadota bacterium]
MCDIIGSGLQRHRQGRVPQSVGARHAVPLRKERRFARDVNHVISRRLVAKAKGTGRGIALEDLKGIRERISVLKAQRRVPHSWGFHQLGSFIEYKARLVGVPQALFQCVSCGFAGSADAIAAENIRRAARMRSYAA